MDTSIGVNLRVTAHSNQGGRKYMEDMFSVAYQPTADDRDLLYAYFGIFDGHGGREAALYAKHNLMDQIVQQKNFWSDDDDLVLKAISDGFLATHYAMWKELEKWPKTASGLPSTSGTTATVAFVRRGKLYIGHVGDSGIVMGFEDPETGFWRAKPLTRDHKPESPLETSRIIESGGKVIVKSGVPRVVWNRPRIGHKGPVRRSTHIDEIPFLAVARSLGDLWSYNSEQDEFIVSPQPDVSVIDIDVMSHRCLILGTDGLWNMLSPQDAVNTVYFAEKNNERQALSHPADLSMNWINPSKRLVDRALDRWLQHGLRADNTSVVTVVIDPPGPPKDRTCSPVSRIMPSRVAPSSSSSLVSTSSQHRQSTHAHPTPPVSAHAHPARVSNQSQIPGHPRVIVKTTASAASADTSTQSVTPQDRVIRQKRKRTPVTGRVATKQRRRGNAVNSSSTAGNSQPPEVASASNHELGTVQEPSSHSSSSVGARGGGPQRSSHSNDQSLNQNRVHDDVQIHEISSSSESGKSDKSRGGKKRKRFPGRKEKPVLENKKAKLDASSNEGRRVTRNSSSSSSIPEPELPIKAKPSPRAKKQKQTAPIKLRSSRSNPLPTLSLPTPAPVSTESVSPKAKTPRKSPEAATIQKRTAQSKPKIGNKKKLNAIKLLSAGKKKNDVPTIESGRILRSTSRASVRTLRGK